MNTNNSEMKNLAQAMDGHAVHAGTWNMSSVVPFETVGVVSDAGSATRVIGMVEQRHSENHSLIRSDHPMTLSSMRCDAIDSTMFVAPDTTGVNCAGEFSNMHVDPKNSAIQIDIDKNILAVVIVEVRDASIFEQLKSRSKAEHELLRAIEEDQFVIHYQPRVDIMSGEMVGMEALVRWMHPERGLLPPDEFIPLAESTGLIVTLGALVMHKVCAQLARWKDQQIRLVPISVNVSPRQFNEGTVDQLVAACLAEHGISPRLLEIELTESAMIGDVEFVVHEVNAINALGIKVHVDDFGTGYSALSLLQKVKMDVLKIDRAFTYELGKGKQAEVFFQAIVSMAKALGMSVVAEGGETEEQVRILQNLCCDELQGNFVSRPLSAADVAGLLQKRFLYS